MAWQIGKRREFNVEYRFLIEPLMENNKLHFIHSERFTGSMVAPREAWLDKVIKWNFEIMIKALKDRAEKR